jgi:hypothetical protein
MKVLVRAHSIASRTPDLPELARDLFARGPEREKLLRFWIETS